MADILLDTQSAPATPAAGQGLLWFDSQSKAFLQKNESGIVQGDSIRAAVAQQTGFAADTYLTNGGLQIPSSGMQAGMFWEWKILISKTAAGVATPIFQIRVGAAQTTADTSRVSITTSAQTAAIDSALVTVIGTCRNVGASGVIRASVWIQHNLAATGFASTPAGFNLVEASGSAYDNSAEGGKYIGLSINGGASAAWTIEQAIGRLYMG